MAKRKLSDYRGLFVYIAQPYRINPQESMKKALEYKKKLFDNGINSYSPIIEHHTLVLRYYEELKGKDEMFLNEDLAHIRVMSKNKRSCILFAEGWRDSNGCVSEHILAKALKIPCYSLNEFFEGNKKIVELNIKWN